MTDITHEQARKDQKTLGKQIKAFGPDEVDAFNRLSSYIAQCEKREAELDERVAELEHAPWPKWADDVRKKLLEYGVDPGPEEGWDIGEDFEEWLEGCLDAETRPLFAKLASMEAETERLQALLNEAGEEMNRLANTCDSLIAEVSDPGTEALAAVFCARALVSKIRGGGNG